MLELVQVAINEAVEEVQFVGISIADLVFVGVSPIFRSVKGTALLKPDGGQTFVHAFDIQFSLVSGCFVL